MEKKSLFSSISDETFFGCPHLASATISSSVTEIGDYAFAYCYELANAYCLAENVPTTGGIAFEGTDISSATLYVPAASVEQYQTTEPWSGFGTIVGLTQDEIDAVDEVEASETTAEMVRYDLQGRQISTPQNQRPTNVKGINIIRHADGSTRKVLVK